MLAGILSRWKLKRIDLKELYKNFKTVRRELLTLLGLSLTVYFLIEFFLIDIPQLFSGGYKLGQFVGKICQSYISAFIFYFIVVHLKSEKDKRNINEYVGQKVYDILTSAHLFIQPLHPSFRDLGTGLLVSDQQ